MQELLIQLSMHLQQCLKQQTTVNLILLMIVKEYGEKAKIMKKLFTDNGFYIVYDKDEDEPIADGFYFTFSYPGYSGEELLNELIYYGISAISLSITGSERLEEFVHVFRWFNVHNFQT
ncbi:MAG: hypothetical protein MZV64_25535 [Ignavibacteriales bacterium]|nr:hypothetical protein [Ignavibacteriales bacterium]